MMRVFRLQFISINGADINNHGTFSDKMAAGKLEDVPSLESLVSRAKEMFREKFGREAEVGGAAPGRVNLIGKLKICLMRS